MKNVIPYSRQNILNNDVKKVIRILKSDFISRGPENRNFENSEYFYKNVFSLPLHLKLNKQKIKFICKNILKWINK